MLKINPYNTYSTEHLALKLKLDQLHIQGTLKEKQEQQQTKSEMYGKGTFLTSHINGRLRSEKHFLL